MKPNDILTYEVETVDCALCGSDDYEVYLSRAKELYNGLDAFFDVVRCRRCGFVFTNPRPTAATIGCFYPDSAKYYQPKKERIASSSRRDRPWRRRREDAALACGFGYPRNSPFFVRVTPLGKILRRLRFAHVPQFIPDGRLLDIGCAWGGYLWRMRELGWDVHGIELNPRAAVFAREELGLDTVRCGSFDDLDYPAGHFDVVHMSMVLEHLHHPGKALQKIYHLLRDGGQLILSVPDVSGFEMRLFRSKCYPLQVPQHLSHFSPKTLTHFLAKSGFCVDNILHQQTKKDFLKSAEYLDSGFRRRMLTNGLIRSFLLSPLVALLARMGKTSRMSVFAHKANSGEIDGSV